MVRQTAQQQQQLGVAQPREEKYLEKAKSVGCLVYDSDLVKLPTGDYILRTQPYKEAFVLCGAERFNEQPIVSFCTAFLTAPAEVTTAGHCVPFTVGELERLRLVFGFHLDSATLPGHFLIKATDVYSIRQVKSRFDSPNAADWAVLKLDRPCPDRPPLELGDGKPAPGAGVYTIGHPCGLPLKIADNARVKLTSIPANGCFRATLDTYGGNSGSPVFNAETHKVEGILVRGGDDFKLANHGQCNISVITTDNYQGESVCSISLVTP